VHAGQGAAGLALARGGADDVDDDGCGHGSSRSSGKYRYQ
jgi:hypothetical protein